MKHFHFRTLALISRKIENGTPDINTGLQNSRTITFAAMKPSSSSSSAPASSSAASKLGSAAGRRRMACSQLSFTLLNVQRSFQMTSPLSATPS